MKSEIKICFSHLLPTGLRCIETDDCIKKVIKNYLELTKKFSKGYIKIQVDSSENIINGYY